MFGIIWWAIDEDENVICTGAMDGFISRNSAREAVKELVGESEHDIKAIVVFKGET